MLTALFFALQAKEKPGCTRLIKALKENFSSDKDTFRVPGIFCSNL